MCATDMPGRWCDIVCICVSVSTRLLQTARDASCGVRDILTEHAPGVEKVGIPRQQRADVVEPALSC